MLAITGSMNIFHHQCKRYAYGSSSPDRYCKDRFPNPYKGDIFAFMSKNRQLMKLVRYENCMYAL